MKEKTQFTGTNPLHQSATVLRLLVGAAQAKSMCQAKILDPLFTVKNTGNGGAVLRKWDAVQNADLVAFADVDGAVGAAEIVRAEAFFQATNYDALFANRIKMLGRTVERTLKRHLSGRIFATLVSNVARIPAYDTQCGLKILRSSTRGKIRPHQESVGFGFDVELCLLLLKFRFRVNEFPVDWRDVPGSKVSSGGLKDSPEGGGD